MNNKKTAKIIVAFLICIANIILITACNRDYYFGPYQSVIDSLYEDVLIMDGIESIEIKTSFSQASGETTTWFEIYGEDANRYLENTKLFEEVFLPYLVENNDLMTALRYDCAEDCNHRHIRNAGDYLQIRINDTVYASSTAIYGEIINYQVWQCVDETIYLEDYR